MFCLKKFLFSSREYIFLTYGREKVVVFLFSTFFFLDRCIVFLKNLLKVFDVIIS